MKQIFDERSGCRERLYLLSVLRKSDNTARWAYNPHHDAWHSVSGQVLKVRYEASRSLEILAEHGIKREDALEMAGYPV